MGGIRFTKTRVVVPRKLLSMVRNRKLALEESRLGDPLANPFTELDERKAATAGFVPPSLNLRRILNGGRV
jgi:hypothetical protein